MVPAPHAWRETTACVGATQACCQQGSKCDAVVAPTLLVLLCSADPRLEKASAWETDGLSPPHKPLFGAITDVKALALPCPAALTPLEKTGAWETDEHAREDAPETYPFGV